MYKRQVLPTTVVQTTWVQDEDDNGPIYDPRCVSETATIIMVTHDSTSASYCSRILFLRDGRLSGELRRGAADRAAFYRRIVDVATGMGEGMSDAC